MVTTCAPLDPEFALGALPKVRPLDEVLELVVILLLLFPPAQFFLRYFVDFGLLFDSVLFASQAIVEGVFFAGDTILFLANSAVKLPNSCF